MSLPRVAVSVPLVLSVAMLWLAPAASAEMFQYVDSKGRLHFTQDIGQVPPEYRNQVERKVLKKEISITGETAGRAAGGSLRPDDRVREMERRKARLRQAAQQRARNQRQANAGAPRPAPAKAAEPRKYDKDCSDYNAKGRCRRILRPEWQRWNAANGGQNGKPTLRRKIGDD